MIRVDSSSIESVGHDGVGNLYVKFAQGKFYTFFNVPRIVYLGLLGAKSTGQYFDKNVRGRYDTDVAKEGLS